MSGSVPSVPDGPTPTGGSDWAFVLTKEAHRVRAIKMHGRTYAYNATSSGNPHCTERGTAQMSVELIP